VRFTSSDAHGILPVDSTLSNGVGTFSVTLNTAGSQTITATDTLSTNPTITGSTSAITTRGLVVSTFTPTADGFKLAFTKPFIPENVTLYGSNLTPQDVTLIGPAGPVVGSLILDPDNKGLTFKASSAALLAFNSTAVL